MDTREGYADEPDDPKMTQENIEAMAAFNGRGSSDKHLVMSEFHSLNSILAATKSRKGPQ